MKQLLAFAFCIFAACGFLSDTEEPYRDCRFVAEIEPAEDKKEAQFVFYRVLAELLDGKANCGFGFAAVKVEKPTYRGESLFEIKEGETPKYAARGRVDKDDTVIAFESDNASYIQDLSSVERAGTRLRVKMRRVLPE